jgi:hypothetical protein
MIVMVRNARRLPVRLKLSVAVFLTLGVVMIGGSVPMLATWTSGTLTKATITQCTVNGRPTYSEDCTGTWTATDGHAVVGTIFGADDGMVGKRIEVRVNGDSAHVTSIATPLMLLGLGSLCCLLALLPLTQRGQRNQTRRRQVTHLSV